MPWLRALAIAVLGALALVGCGGAPKPEARVASSQGAIRGASEAGADAVPQATLHLKLAQEQREQALELIQRGENHRADMLLARAEADAELALALARAASAKADADKTDEELERISKQADE
ncbi:MAG TPA: hypothetical protein VLM79_09255 [Kofleriaceae bacterium]|nr:hypothetical protein [Kofleriaceae bacterium]